MITRDMSSIERIEKLADSLDRVRSSLLKCKNGNIVKLDTESHTYFGYLINDDDLSDQINHSYTVQGFFFDHTTDGFGLSSFPIEWVMNVENTTYADFLIWRLENGI